MANVNKINRKKGNAYRRYNILPDLKRLSGLNVRDLIPLLEIADESELRALKRIVGNINQKMMSLERKARQPWRRW